MNVDNIKQFFSSHKKILIPVGVLAVGLAGFSFLGGGGGNLAELQKADTTLVARKNFANTVTESGTVISEDSSDVFAQKSLPVSSIEVEVGDTVVQGQIIAKLDDSSIRQQIAAKEALIGSTNRAAGVQVKGAQDKLNEAVKGKAEGTNAQVVSANAGVLQAYDQWQLAEKTYDDYLRSLDMGYNDAVAAQISADTNLQNSLNTQSLAYEQSREKLAELEIQTRNAEYSYQAASAQVEALKSEDNAVTRRMNDLTLEIENLSAQLQMRSGVGGAMTSNVTGNVTTDNTAVNDAASDVNGANAMAADASLRADEVDMDAIRADIENRKRELNELTMRSAELKTDIAEAEAEKSKFKALLDTNHDTRLALEKEIEQQALGVENAQKTMAAQAKQDQLAKQSREDTLRTYQKNAADARNAYERAKENVTVALAQQDSEIRALQSGVEQAQAGGDNSVNSVDLKNLYEELEETTIKAPISGTITQVDMVKGQVPTQAVAHIQTVKRTVVESQIKEFDFPKVHVGMEVEITSDALGRDTVFKGKVASIDPVPKAADPSAQKQEVSYGTKITFEDPDNKLQPGMTVRIRYVLEAKDDVIVIPATAIYKKNDKDFVLLVDDSDTATIREVNVRIITGNDVESVVESDHFKGKVRVLNMPDQYPSGTEVQLVDTVATP
ncbi:efflux RND transporter periplasmic adaptor subunit [Peptoniphilus equinus]|uniref:Efflux RND transporter periplasmic adaptor subunit n=1 Tax=Peptoniphilus equinus TaxID=3016343 RepID=A0ABY7QTZ2_9FIRM|nr:efflux RND transporter periplasmic adaptor subunit [Peptoniphilus equinus]WBW50254.1 efflux RND transporter periplasmic adaptor subunit [Peptoniphilus equinus]